MDKDAAVKLWQECFEEEPYDLVSAAVYALIKTRPTLFRLPSERLQPRSSGSPNLMR